MSAISGRQSLSGEQAAVVGELDRGHSLITLHGASDVHAAVARIGGPVAVAIVPALITAFAVDPRNSLSLSPITSGGSSK